MKIVTVALICALPLSGCSTVYSGLQKCERHYDGTVSGGTIQPAVLAGSAKIDCCPVGTYSNPDHTFCLPLPPGTPVPG